MKGHDIKGEIYFLFVSGDSSGSATPKPRPPGQAEKAGRGGASGAPKTHSRGDAQTKTPANLEELERAWRHRNQRDDLSHRESQHLRCPNHDPR